MASILRYFNELRTWSAISAANDIIDVLPVANGGTGDSGTAWTAYTPTITARTGVFTSVSATGRYKQIGKTVFFKISITITTNGTAGTAIQATLPVNMKDVNFAFVGRENAVTGFLMIGFTDTVSVVLLQKYDGTYLGTDGYNPIMSGSYEAV